MEFIFDDLPGEPLIPWAARSMNRLDHDQSLRLEAPIWRSIERLYLHSHPKKIEHRSITGLRHFTTWFTFLSFWGKYSSYLVEMALAPKLTGWAPISHLPPDDRMPPRHWKRWKALAQRQNQCLRKRQHKRRNAARNAWFCWGTRMPTDH